MFQFAIEPHRNFHRSRIKSFSFVTIVFNVPEAICRFIAEFFLLPFRSLPGWNRFDTQKNFHGKANETTSNVEHAAMTFVIASASAPSRESKQTFGSLSAQPLSELTILPNPDSWPWNVKTLSEESLETIWCECWDGCQWQRNELKIFLLFIAFLYGA